MINKDRSAREVIQRCQVFARTVTASAIAEARAIHLIRYPRELRVILRVRHELRLRTRAEQEERVRMRILGWTVRLGCAVIALYGLVLTIDGVAYLTGLGPDVTIHIERTHTEYVPTGENDLRKVTVGDGYYLDDSGRRHATSLPGDDLKPGAVVHTRRPLLAESLVFDVRMWWQAAAEIALGLFVTMSLLLMLYIFWTDD